MSYMYNVENEKRFTDIRSDIIGINHKLDNINTDLKNLKENISFIIEALNNKSKKCKGKRKKNKNVKNK